MNITFQCVNSMQRIFPSAPSIESESGAKAVKNTRHNVQLALSSDKHLYDLRICVESEIKDYIKVYAQRLVPITSFPQSMDDYYESTAPTIVPDVVEKVDCFNLSPRAFRGFSVVFDLDKKVKSGEYKTTFTLKTSNNEVLATTEYTLTVIDKVAKETDLVLTNWMHYDCICQKHNVKPFSQKFYKVFAEYLKVFTECGYNMLLTPLFTPPLDTAIGGERLTAQLIKVEKTENGYNFDFSAFEKFVKFAQKHGVKYFELSHLYTQWGGNACPKIMATVNGKQERIFGWDVDSYDIRYRDFLTQFIPLLLQTLKKLGIDKASYFHLTDEPNDKHIEKYSELRSFTKSLIGDMPTMDAMSHYEFYEQGLVDVPVPEIDAFPSFKKNNVYPMFVYNCCNPSNGYYSNRFMAMPLHRTRIIGTQMFATEVQGYLHWGYNFYRSRLSISEIDPYFVTDAEYSYPSGDGFIVYPTEDGATHSLRSLAGREAFDDYRILSLAKEVLGKDKTDALIAEYGIENYDVYPRSAKAHFEFMQKVISLIDEN